MAVTTFKPQRGSNTPTVLIYVLAVIGIGLLIYLGISVLTNMGALGGKSALSVSVLDGQAEVYLNNTLLGQTPYDSTEIKTGENTVRVKNASTSYEVSIDFLRNSEVVLNRDLGVSTVFSSGQNFWIEKEGSGAVLSVVSEPDGAKVFIDNTEVGATPYSSNNLSEGDYELRIEKAGYESQTARVKVQKGFKLNVVMKLFPMPVPATVNLLEGSTDLYDVHSSDSMVSSDAASWVKAVPYWNRTRGINLADTGVNKEMVFGYFIDYAGRLYDKDGNDITGATDLGELAAGAYLRRAPDGPGLSEPAKTILASVNVVAGKKATVLETGLGWLNVRSEPSLDGEVLVQVNVGESFTVLEESTGWVKIRVDVDTEGWVSSTYVEIE